MIVEPDFVDGPKLVALKERLGRRHGPEAVEYVLRLWGHCQAGKRGHNWGPVSAGYVEQVARWMGPKGVLFAALTEVLVPGRSPLVELAANGSEVPDVVIHDWADHNGSLVANWNRNPNGRRGTGGTDGVKPGLNPRLNLGVMPGLHPGGNPERSRDRSDRTGQDRTGQVTPSLPPVPGVLSPPIAPSAAEGGDPIEGWAPKAEEVLDFAAAFAGEAALNLPPVIGREFASRWYTRMLARDRFPRNWKRILVSAWRDEWWSTQPKKGGPLSAERGTRSAEPEWAAERGRREALARLRSEIAEHPANEASTSFVGGDCTEALREDLRAKKRQLRELQAAMAPGAGEGEKPDAP